MAKREEALRDVNSYLNIYERAEEMSVLLCAVILVFEETLEEVKTALEIQYNVCFKSLNTFHIHLLSNKQWITYVFSSLDTRQDTYPPEYHELVLLSSPSS